MNKKEILSEISSQYDSLFTFLSEYPSERWAQGPDGKWTAGQHVVHLIQSAKPLNKALKYPGIVLKWKFGKSNRSPRSYENVIDRYKERLAAVDGRVQSPFSSKMPETPPSSKDITVGNLEKEKDRFVKIVEGLSDRKMDTCLLPHPLMGRMPIREIVMWSAYHVGHHLKILKEKY